MILDGKNVAITGASSGIGLEILKLLLENGCRVAACARHIENIDIKDDHLFLKKCDVSKKEEIDSFFEFAEEKLGGIDLYISNAGFAYYEKIGGPDWEHAEAIMDTNFISAVYAAEKMKQTHGTKPYNFVVTASAMGLLSLPGYALYSGTKAAVRGFADAYRHELERGQHFQVVYPVATKTEFFKRAGNGTPVPWPTQDAATVAKRVIKDIRKDINHIFPSTMFRITNAVSRVFPFVFKIYVDINNKAFRKWLNGKAA
ncbi:MAG: SDR family NAD(P)-dependent oxidoreductase [Clostridiales bacterium]|nr:SDR family NAD(P)-dependent oxidoreductase [Candidatus Cacconaster stercorequi]